MSSSKAAQQRDIRCRSAPAHSFPDSKSSSSAHPRMMTSKSRSHSLKSIMQKIWQARKLSSSAKVHEIKEKEVPEIDDDFVKDVSEFDTLDELKASKREELQKAAEARAEDQMKNSVIEKIFEANDIDVPERPWSNEEIDSMINEFDQQLRAQGMDLNTYFKYMGEDMADFRERSETMLSRRPRPECS